MLQEELRALEQQAADLPEGEIRPGHPLVDDIVEVRAALGEAMARLGHGPGGMMRGPGGMPDGAAVAEEEAVPGLLRTPEERGAWEAALVDALGTLLAGEGKGARLREIEARYTDAHDEGAVFKDELQERTDVGALNEAVRLAAYPGLWRYRRPFTFEQFQASFAREPRLAEEYPVLSELLTRQSELRALRYLPQLFRWLELLMYVLTPQLPVLCPDERMRVQGAAGQAHGQAHRTPHHSLAAHFLAPLRGTAGGVAGRLWRLCPRVGAQLAPRRGLRLPGAFLCCAPTRP